MNTRRKVIILILILVVGFASVTTSLILKGNIGVGVELDDFDVIFIEALLDGKEDSKAAISEDKKTITFTTDKFINKGDSARLDYKVKNTSTQYDADVAINCTNDKSEYITVTSEFDGNRIPLENPVNIKAQEVKNGYINAELTKVYAGEDTSIEIKCQIIFTATSREDYAYSLNFDSNGGSKIDDKSVTLNDRYGELEIPEKEGYTFLGWYNELDEKVDSSTILDSKGDRTLYAKWTPVCPYNAGQVWNFAYTGNEQEFTVPCDGEYKIELWGAGTYRAGGAYTSGNISLLKNSEFYVYVGGEQQLQSNTMIFNSGTESTFLKSYWRGKSSSGATDIRTVNGTYNETKSLTSRIMVSAGSGSNDNIDNLCVGGAGGGLLGYNGTTSPTINSYGHTDGGAGGGGSQTSGGTSFNASSGKFGIGAQGVPDEATDFAGSGGAGWYGGGAGYDWDNSGCGGGGSSYISGHTGSVAVTSLSSSTPKSGCSTGTTNKTCSLSPTNYVFSNTKMIDGLGYKWTNVKGDYTGMPTHDGTSTMTGNIGNGYAKITYLGG